MLAAADAITAAFLGVTIALDAGAAWPWALLPVPIALLGAKTLGLYDQDHRSIRHLTADELPVISALVGITVIGSMLLIPGTDAAAIFLWLLAGAVLLSFSLRAGARWLWRATTPRERTLVIGDGEPAEAIRRKVKLFDDMHLELLRVRDLGPVATAAANGQPPLSEVLPYVDRVVVAWAHADPTMVGRLLEFCRRSQTKLSVVSPFSGRARPARHLSMVADLPVLEYNTWDVPRSTMVLKRGFDIAVSSLALVLLSPVFIGIMLAIKLGDGGPVLFRQLRAGRKGKPFRMLKFRSMVVDAESRLGDLVDLDGLKAPMFKLNRDPRITPVGRFLRRHSLDELPQLINVLIGDMSIVGPRPEELSVVERYRPEHRFRLDLKPGVTGPMQVFGRAELTFEERLALDLEYIENLSVARDIHIIVLTLPALVRGKGAF